MEKNSKTIIYGAGNIGQDVAAGYRKGTYQFRLRVVFECLYACVALRSKPN